MRNWNRLIVGGLAVALSATACDPYASENTGAPYIAAVFATDGNPDGAAFTEGTGSGSTWAIADIPSTCHPDPAVPSTGTVLADQYAIFVTANKVLSGPSIETTAGSCLPTAGWLTTTGPTPVPAKPPPAETWFSCYFPSSPSPQLGGSVVIFKVPNSTGYTNSWNAVAVLEGDAINTVTYTVFGTVSDQQGHPLDMNVTATVAPNAVGQTPNLTAVDTGTAVNLAWGNGACGGTPTYTVERTAGVAAGAACPSTFATLAAGLTTQSYTDPLATAGQKYCYRVFVTVNAVDGANSAVKANVPAAPGAPTFSGVTATSVTVNWTAVPTALTYTIQRAPDNAGVPGTFATIASGVAGTTYTDTPVLAATIYWYRVIAVGPGGPSANGASASVTTP